MRRNKREFVEDFILARTHGNMNINKDAAKFYVETAIAFWDAIEKQLPYVQSYTLDEIEDNPF